jgi:hypothetical protein
MGLTFFRSAGCAVRGARFGVRVAGCGVRGASSALRGVRDAGAKGIGSRAERLARENDQLVVLEAKDPLKHQEIVYEIHSTINFIG